MDAREKRRSEKRAMMAWGEVGGLGQGKYRKKRQEKRYTSWISKQKRGARYATFSLWGWE
jgi:hypothetical protein